MSVELPFAPVDAIIRRNAGSLRVSADAAEALASRVQRHGATLAVGAAETATADGRQTLIAGDFGVEPDVDREDSYLASAPIERSPRLDTEERRLV